MYLHLGNDIVVKLRHVLGIFDIENSSISKHTKRFLETAEKQGQVVNVSTELPKSFIVCVDEFGKTKVYISQISPQTLKKRTGFLDGISLKNIPF